MTYGSIFCKAMLQTKLLLIFLNSHIVSQPERTTLRSQTAERVQGAGTKVQGSYNDTLSSEPGWKEVMWRRVGKMLTLR